MILLGEKCNSSIPSALEAMNSGDDQALISLLQGQEQAGASYLDLNTAMASDELGAMIHLVELVQKHTSCGVMVDSADPEIVREAVGHVEPGRPLLLNSVTADERHEILPLVKERGCGVVALPMTEDGIPDTPELRLEQARHLAEIFSAQGIPLEHVFFDILVESCAVNENAGRNALGTARLFREVFPETHLTCGLSNISFGLPKRPRLNAALLPALCLAGLDSPILDVTSPSMKEAILAAEALSGQDEYCMNYIEAFR